MLHKNSLSIQALAADALDTGQFNFQAAIAYIRALVPLTSTADGAKITTKNPADTFHILLELYLDDKMSQKTAKIFIAGLQAGLDS